MSQSEDAVSADRRSQSEGGGSAVDTGSGSGSGLGGSTALSDRNTTNVDEEHMISFSSYQLCVFVTCYFGYCMMLYNRKSFIFTLPFVIAEQYYSSFEVGMIVSAQTFTYTFSRFWASWASDHYPPRYMFMGGMFFTGFVMLAFADQEDWPNIMLLTAANGLAQGFGWPAVAKMIRAWYPPTQFGFWFALLTTAANVVATVGPSIANSLAVSYGWRSALQIPAIAAILLSVIVPYCTWDKPSDVGYEDQLTMFGTLEGHWSDLAGSDFMALLVSTVFLLSMVKTSYQDWGHLFLMQERGLSTYTANQYKNSMEVGGLIGCIFLGALTDFMIRKGYYFGTGKSPRMNAVLFCVAGTCLFLNLFLFTVNPDTSKVYMGILGFLMGATLYGAIGLIGTIAIEVAPIHITGAAHAIVGIAANLGYIAAGTPINYIASAWNWLTVLLAGDILCLVVFLILVIGKDIKASYSLQGKGPSKLPKRQSSSDKEEKSS